MSVLRRAGVWLGLVEEDDGYEEPEHRDWADGSGGGRDRRRGYRDDYPDDDDNLEPSMTRGGEADELPPASRNRLTERVAQRRAERGASGERTGPSAPGGGSRGNVRPITRETTVSYLTEDNLALAPRVHAEERPVTRSEEERRDQITPLHPTPDREARTIGEHFREGTPVIMNLTEMDESDARRLVDFGAGLAFGLRGTMERVTNRVFLLSPANVQVTAEDKAKIAEGGFFHQR